MSRLRALPLRWGLALTSAGLTFAILLLFALVIGALAGRQVREEFYDDVRLTTADLQQQIQVRPTFPSGLGVVGRSDRIAALGAGGAVIRVISASGEVLVETERAPDLGSPRDGSWVASGYRVVSRPLFASSSLSQPVAFVQYGKPQDSVNSTLARLRLFLALGVLGGTALALLAGLAVARRAIGPIARLTGAAKEVARTRDPATRLPKPAADDEVADLANTLEEMLMALDAAQGETEATLARQRQFVADASHELRTPLTSVLTNLELLEAACEGENREIAGSALRSSRRMRRLVGDLLLLARADAGREAPHGPVDLADVLHEAAAEEAPIADDHEIEVEAPAGLIVEGSSDDLHRLVLNLIENAITHTPAGTSVDLSARTEQDWIVLEVSDDGPGVPEEAREMIFERFVHGGSDGAADCSGASGGSGLGLSIVRAVARTHGGSVAVTDSDLGGARFVVRLPLLRQASLV